MGQFREAIEQQEVAVNRSVKGVAPSRVRLAVALNCGRDQETDVGSYLFPCLALRDTYVFRKNADVTRFDLYVGFGNKDVSPTEIANRTTGTLPMPVEVFRRHILWVFSRGLNHIRYEEEAKDAIKKRTHELIGKYACTEIPIVHLGLREVLSRLSVAQAASEHSTDAAHELIIVRAEHVERVCEYYEKVLDALGLREYKLDTEGRSTVNESEALSLATMFDETHWAICDAIKYSPCSSPVLAKALGVSDKTIKRHYVSLSEHSIIETRPGKGITLTARGMSFMAWAMKQPRDIGTKNVPKGTLDEYAGTENVPMSLERESSTVEIHQGTQGVPNATHLPFSDKNKAIIKIVANLERHSDMLKADEGQVLKVCHDYGILDAEERINKMVNVSGELYNPNPGFLKVLH
jgi:biotin operon repressor